MSSNRIKKTEAQCLTEHAPYCQAACPLHLPARTLVNLIGSADFDGAAALMQTYCFFPRLVAKACPAPCEKACIRDALGGSIAVNLLERTVAANVAFPTPRIVPEMQIRKKIAVIGGGMSALAAAWSLYEKGFALTVFEKSGNLGGTVRSVAGVGIDDIALDLAPLMALPIKFRLHTEVGVDMAWDAILNEYDGVYLSGDNALSGGTIDRKTLQTANPKVFAGGSMLRTGESYSIVDSLADGRRAAVSLDRFLKNKSLTAARLAEGTYASRLQVSVQDCEPKTRVQPAQHEYTVAESLAEAGRCLDCRCTDCIRECRLAERFGQFTHSYIREIANAAPAMGGGSDKNEDAGCTLCGLCHDICPGALPLREADKGGSAVLTREIDFPVRDMLFSNSDEFSLCRHRLRYEESRYLFFPGCQMAAATPHYIIPAYRYLQQKLDQVGIFLGCCGAPADWAGQPKLYEQTMNELLDKWSRMGKPVLIVGCTTCQQQFKAAEPQMQVKLLWEVFAEYGLPQVHREPRTVAVHDSCTARYDHGVHAAVRRILHEAGYSVEELQYSRERTKCCGYSSLAFCDDHEAALNAVMERTGESPLDYVAYCTVCRNYFTGVGKPTYHILDVIFGRDSHGTACQPAPGLRQQEENRRALKRALLQEFYDGAHGRDRDNGPLLFISPQVRRRLEERLIDESSIQTVIAFAEAHNRKLLRPTDNHFIAGYKPGIITYWVEYAPKDGGYEVYNAYSHRISIGED